MNFNNIAAFRKAGNTGILFLITVFSSCVSTKDITYFQPADKSMDESTMKEVEKYTPRIHEGDILSITVSSLNKEANEMFNPMSQSITNASQAVGTIAPSPATGFTVDASGNISLPMIGKIRVQGLTSRELSIQLASQLEHYLEAPTVIVRIANYTISVLGEVARPAVYTIPNEKMTLPEALAMAGDISIYGKRKNVLLIRETDGNREFVRVDMTKRDLFTSPYYYLHSGDVIYVEPMAGKVTSTDRTIQLTPIVISSLTLLVLMINTFVK